MKMKERRKRRTSERASEQVQSPCTRSHCRKRVDSLLLLLLQLSRTHTEIGTSSSSSSTGRRETCSNAMVLLVYNLYSLHAGKYKSGSSSAERKRQQEERSNDDDDDKKEESTGFLRAPSRRYWACPFFRGENKASFLPFFLPYSLYHLLYVLITTVNIIFFFFSFFSTLCISEQNDGG